MPTTHAILAPSAAKRWMTCAPSARLEAQVPGKDTAYTKEGTIAHAMAETLLRICLDPDTAPIDDFTDKFQVSYNNLEFPILIKYGIKATDDIALLPFVGPYFSYAIGGKTKQLFDQSGNPVEKVQKVGTFDEKKAYTPSRTAFVRDFAGRFETAFPEGTASARFTEVGLLWAAVNPVARSQIKQIVNSRWKMDMMEN